MEMIGVCACIVETAREAFRRSKMLGSLRVHAWQAEGAARDDVAV
jgi:hypothetical protein